MQGMDYGNEYYAESDEDDSAEIPRGGAQYMNYPSANAMFQQQQKQAAGKPSFGQPVANSASGVPFYGQQNKAAAFGGYGQASNPIGGGGGFTYGMAQKGGNLFGPPATAPQTSNLYGNNQYGGSSAQPSGLFQFGSVSQFGGLGGGNSSLFGGGGASAADDPYANIAIDLNKVKKQEPPPKLYEHKTEEEKKAKNTTSTSVTTKSNLKKSESDVKQAQAAAALADNKRNVTFGKSTTYEVEAGEDESGEYHTKDIIKEGGKGSPRPGAEKKVIAEKDLSDGRSEREKILERLEKEQREQIEEYKEMNQWKQQEKKQIEDSVGDSSSSNPPLAQKKADQSQESYDSNDFENVSASGSGSRPKPVAAYSASAMEEYIKKQKENQGPQKKPVPAATQDYSESSDKYEDEFDSLSRSQTAMQSSALPSPKTNNTTQKAFEYKPGDNTIQKYIKKENKFAQTDEGKYSFMSSKDLEPSSYKEWTLTQNLKDAESLIQDLKSTQATTSQKVFDLETQLKKKDLDYQSMRRDSLNASETAKRLQEQLRDAVHKVSLYKLETEELIKQIDVADARAREKEDEVRLCEAEWERKLKMTEERHRYKAGKQEEREVYEVKRQAGIEREEWERKVEQAREEIEYYQEKIAKIEAENKGLRMGGKGESKRIRELEEEIEIIKTQKAATVTVSADLKSFQGKDLSKDEQLKLQREVQHLDLLLKGYQEESEKSLSKTKSLSLEIKTLQSQLLQESKKVKELQQKALLEQNKVYVEPVKEEVDIDTANLMGAGKAISQKQLGEMHAEMQRMQGQLLDREREATVKEARWKEKVNKAREEKADKEKLMFEMEYVMGEKEQELRRIREEWVKDKENMGIQISELQDKVSFFRQNQKLLTDQDQETQSQLKDLVSLRTQLSTLQSEVKRTRDLEKKCKLLEETLKAKTPNSIPMMLSALTAVDDGNSEWKKRVKQLEVELEEKDKEYERRVRTLRQETERVREQYQGAKGPEGKRLKELEDELETTKQYYQKRIREIEDKYKFNKPTANKGGAATKTKDVVFPDTKALEEQIDKITKERNILAQKVVNLETQNNKRRSSFSGVAPVGEDAKYAVSAVNAIANLIRIVSDNKKSALTLIEAALICVEQIKVKDPQRNQKLSQLLMSLTQDLNTAEKVNDKILGDLLDATRPEPSQFDLKRLPSEKEPINFYPSPTSQEEQLDSSRPSRPLTGAGSKPPKPQSSFTNPFEAGSPPRAPRDLLKSIADIDFERAVQERKLNPKGIPVAQVYQIIKEEGEGRKVTLDEVKGLIQHVRDKSGVVSQKPDEIELNDLINALMDVSIDILDSPPAKLKEQSDRYTHDNKRQPTATSREDQDKLERLQRLVFDLQSERAQLQDKIDKLEQSKQRMERILKQTVNHKSSNNNQDLVEELTVLMKRIEYLEQQSEERTKSQYSDHNGCTRRIQQLQEEIELERQEKVRVLSKKNAEVAHFKKELESLLGELQISAMKKARV